MYFPSKSDVTFWIKQLFFKTLPNFSKIFDNQQTFMHFHGFFYKQKNLEIPQGFL